MKREDLVEQFNKEMPDRIIENKGGYMKWLEEKLLKILNCEHHYVVRQKNGNPYGICEKCEIPINIPKK